MDIYSRHLLVLSVLLTSACSGETSPSSECPANATIDCLCVDGSSGLQVCNGDGTGYLEACACEAAPADTTSSPDTPRADAVSDAPDPDSSTEPLDADASDSATSTDLSSPDGTVEDDGSVGADGTVEDDGSVGADGAGSDAATDTGCAPSCGTKECGPDGCGGDCGTCESGSSCLSGTCKLDCPAGQHDCGGQCVDTTTTLQCGASCESCPDTPFGVPECVNGACAVSCDPGYAPCVGCVPLQCVPCGGQDGPCCAEGCHPGLSCFGGVCGCGGKYQLCCNDDSCADGLVCTESGYCSSGGAGEPCNEDLSCQKGYECTGEACVCAVGGSLLSKANFKGGWILGGGRVVVQGHTQGTAYFVHKLNGEVLWGLDARASTGGNDTCAVGDNAEVWCWGSVTALPNAQQGDWPLAPGYIRGDAMRIREENGSFAQATSVSSSCMVRLDGTVACWGQTGVTNNSSVSLFPSTNQCSGCADFPSTVLSEANGAPFTGAVQVSRYQDNICVVTESGELWCWGNNHSGQLGQGDTDHRSYPTRVEGIPPVAEVHAGEFTCVRTAEEGKVLCAGQWSNSSETLLFEPLLAGDLEGDPITGVDQLLSPPEGGRAILRTTDGQVWQAHYSQAATPISMDGIAVNDVWRICRFSDGSTHKTCFIRTDGTLSLATGGTAGWSHFPGAMVNPCADAVCQPSCVDAVCGSDGCGGSCGSCSGDTPLCIEGSCKPDPCVPQCGLNTCGSDGCGGSCGSCDADSPCSDGMCQEAPCVVDFRLNHVLGSNGRVWYLPFVNWYYPEEILLPDGSQPPLFASLAHNSDTTTACAISVDKHLYCWRPVNLSSSAAKLPLGAGLEGEEVPAGHTRPVVVADGSPLEEVVDASITYDGGCAVRSDGTVWCWGNHGGALFQGTESCAGECANHAVQVTTDVLGTPFLGAVKVRRVAGKACAIKADGTVWCWGAGSGGITSTLQEEIFPTLVPLEGEIVVDVAMNKHYSACALTESKHVYCWGTLNQNQLSLDTYGHYAAYAPVPIPAGPWGDSINNAIGLSVGPATMCVVTDDGGALCWGQKGSTGEWFEKKPTELTLGGWPMKSVWKLFQMPDPNGESADIISIITTSGNLFRSSHTSPALNSVDPACPPNNP